MPLTRQPTAAGPYRLHRRLATGAMTEVFLASADGAADPGQTLVLKRILPHLAGDRQLAEAFLTEARLAARLRHANILRILDLDETDGSCFVVTEYVEGLSLRMLATRAAEQGQLLPMDQVAQIGSLACEGLQYAHDLVENGRPLNLVLRHLCPEHMLLSRQGALKLVAFGLAQAPGTRSLTSAAMREALSYAPPEQVRNQPVDRRADVYALGSVLFELLTGPKPFSAASGEKLTQAIFNGPPISVGARRPDCPPELAAILDRALQEDRDRRYPDCRTMQRDLDAFLLFRGAATDERDLASLLAAVSPDLARFSGMFTAMPLQAPTPGEADTAHPFGPAESAPVQSGLDDYEPEWRSPQRSIGADGRIDDEARPSEHPPGLLDAAPRAPLPFSGAATSESLELDEKKLHHAQSREHVLGAADRGFEEPEPRFRWRPLLAGALAAALVVAVVFARATDGAVRLDGSTANDLRAEVAALLAEKGNRALLNVDSEPSGAEIWLGDTLLGTTPYIGDNDYPAADTYRLRVTKRGFKPFEANVSGGRSATIRAKLTK